MFITNQKLICLNDDFPTELAKIYTAFPIKGNTYTCRGLCPAIDIKMREEIGVYLHEIINPRNSHGIELAYKADRFAPLENMTTEQILALSQGNKQKQEDSDLISIPA